MITHRLLKLLAWLPVYTAIISTLTVLLLLLLHA